MSGKEREKNKNQVPMRESVGKVRLDLTGTRGTIIEPSGPLEQVFGDKVDGDKVLGDKIAGDKIVYEVDRAYNVRDLKSPYLGLKNFTYAERTIYAGREKLINHTVARMTAPAAQISLIFVTGASGSGKSSFAQAGLIPALENHYSALEVKHAVFRPEAEPLAALADALWRGLRFPPMDTIKMTPSEFYDFLRTRTPASRINVLVIDQFEQLFTRSTAQARNALISILSQLPPFRMIHTHFIATMRADYLPELFAQPALYEIAKDGVDLRAMSPEELREAIQRPLQVAYPAGNKMLQPELVDKLAQEASKDPTYLPLLQSTLNEIWRKGALTIAAYTNLTDAIEEHANEVLEYQDHESLNPNRPRSRLEQGVLLDILLNLVDVALDDDLRRDVRRWRTKAELASGADDGVRLIDELVEARLLSVATEAGDPMCAQVELIHDSLLSHWDRLRAAIAERRQELRQRARFERYLAEWLAQNRSGDYLIDGVHLAEARELEAHNDIALKSKDAKAFFQASIMKAEAEHQRVLEKERQKADLEKRARREAELRGRISCFAAIGLLVLLGGVIIASLFALRQREIIDSRRLAAQSNLIRNDNLDLSLLLGIEGLKRDGNFEVRNNVFSAVQNPVLITTLRGHTDGVMSVAFSPDGKTLASGSWDHTIWLWDVASGKPVGDPLKGPPTVIYSLAFSRDGKTLASGSWDDSIWVWDVASGKLLGEPLKGHADRVNSVAFSPDGKTLASGSWDHTIRLWDAASGKPIGEPLRGHEEDVLSVAFSPDGKTLGSGSWDHTIRLWDLASGKPIGKPLEGHEEDVLSVAFSPDGKTLASGSWDNTIRLWDVASGKPIGKPLEGHTHRVSSVAFSPDGKILASASDDSTIRLWDVAERRPIGKPLVGHSDAVSSVAFSPDGKMLASGGWDHTIRLWNVIGSARERELLIGHEGSVNSLALSPDGKMLASGSADKTIRLWDAASGKPIGDPLTGHTCAVSSVAFSPDGKTLASGSWDYTIRLWDVAGRKPMGEPLVGHNFRVSSVAFSPDGKTLASGSADKTIRLWDVASRMPIGEPLVGHISLVSNVAFSPDGKTLASGSWDNTIRLWDVASRMPMGEPLGEHKNFVYSVAFSPDGKTLASASADKTIRLWDVANRKDLDVKIRGHTQGVNSVAFSPDGKTLVSGSNDKEIRLWNVADGTPIGAPLAGHPREVLSVVYILDGKMLASGSADLTIRLWKNEWQTLSISDFQDRVCKMVNRNLTRLEWLQYLNEVPKSYIGYTRKPTCSALPEN